MIGVMAIGALALVLSGCELITPGPAKDGPAGLPSTFIQVTPTSADFVAIQSMGGVDTQVFAVRGTFGIVPAGPLTVAIDKESGAGDFTIDGDNCTGKFVDEHGACDIFVKYANATGTGTATAELVVAGAWGGTVRATLTAIALP